MFKQQSEGFEMLDARKYDLETERGRSELAVDKFNRIFDVGAKVLYKKSDIEGQCFAVIKQPARVQGDSTPVVELEHIGTVLISKIEQYFG